MRWRWLDQGALPALACLLESLWLSVVAALIAGVSWPLLVGGTLAIMAVPAATTVSARAGRLSVRMSRTIVLVTALAAMAVLISLQDHTSIRHTAGLSVVDLLFVVLALALNWFGDSLDGTLARVRDR